MNIPYHLRNIPIGQELASVSGFDFGYEPTDNSASASEATSGLGQNSALSAMSSGEADFLLTGFRNADF